jgi:hypothetical protein
MKPTIEDELVKIAELRNQLAKADGSPESEEFINKAYGNWKALYVARTGRSPEEPSEA